MSEIRNGRSPRSVALVGPYSSGKSTLFEALMEAAGAAVKRPADIRNRPMTTEIRLGHCDYLGDPWSILDCPGSIEFAHETRAALAMVDIAVVVCEPVPSRAMTVAPLLKTLADEGVPHMVFINKIDTLDGSISDTLSALQSYTRSPLVLRQVPIVEGETVSGYVDLMSERAYRYRKGQASELMQIPASMLAEEQEALGKLVEVLADHDDGLLEKVLEDVKPTPEELYRDMRKDLLAGAVIEVLVGSAENANGVRRLWKALRHDTPGADETAERKLIELDGPPLAQVFKTAYAGHTGKLSYARVWRGEIKDGATLGGTRLGGVYRFNGNDMVKVPEAVEGEVVAFGRLDGVPTGATLSPGATPEPLPFPEASPPVYAMAITTTDRKDDVKLSGALHKLTEEDASLFITQDKETGETVLHGQGEMHLLTTVEHLAKNYGLKVSTQKPQVAYQGNNPQAGARAWPPETPDRRAWAVRRRQDRHRAARTRVRFRVHRQGCRRRGAAQLHPSGGGGGGGCRPEGAVRLPGGRYRGDIGGWRFPRGGQLRHGIQDRHPDRDEGGPGKGGPGAAGAGGPCDDQRPKRIHAAGAAPAERAARADPGLCRTRRLGGLGRCGGDGARGRTARPDHRAAVPDPGPGHVPAEVRPSGRVARRRAEAGLTGATCATPPLAAGGGVGLLTFSSRPKPNRGTSMPVTAELCDRIVATTWDSLTPEAIAAARRLVLDGLSIAIAGTEEDAIQILAEHYRGFGARGDATVIGMGFRTAPTLAASVNGASMHVLDFEPMWTPSNHALSTTLPAILALAETRDGDGPGADHRAGEGDRAADLDPPRRAGLRAWRRQVPSARPDGADGVGGRSGPCAGAGCRADGACAGDRVVSLRHACMRISAR